MRMRRGSLLGAPVGTAVVVGTAGAVSHRQQQRTQGKRRLRSSSKIKPISRVWLTRRLNNSSMRRHRLPQRLRPPQPPQQPRLI